MKTVCILVVDDEADNFDVIQTLLNISSKKIPSRYEYILHYASGGQQAIEELDNYQPDLILLDVMMPDIDGITVCQTIRQMPKWKTLPIIMVTALNTKLVLSDCLNAGADDFISKPVGGMELRARVNSMLRIKDQIDNIQSLSNVQENAIQYLDKTLKVLQGNLASTLAHELKTPVQGIIGTFDLLMNYSDQMEPSEIHEILGLGNQSAYRLERLIKKILLFLELELKTSKSNPESHPQTHITEAMLTDCIQTLVKQSNRSKDLIVESEDSLVPISHQYLSTILQELVDNSLKFSPSNTPIIIRHSIENNHSKIIITDEGRGMSEEQISMINAFIQFERSVYEQQGLGMGLKLVKKILELEGGKLAIISGHSQGTSAIVTLPLLTSKMHTPVS